ncbi:MAG: hypothetical protein ACFFDN_52310 [Candidatus Hodarchaeota archaeon]
MTEKNTNKSIMLSYFFEDPKDKAIERELKRVKVSYYYFKSDIKLRTEKNQVLNGSLLLGNIVLIYNENEFHLNQFDIFFKPPESQFVIKGGTKQQNASLVQVKKCQLIEVYGQPLTIVSLCQV